MMCAVATDPTTHFRSVLGRFPTGVAVVTAPAESGPVGLAVGSFCSVSLDPPLVLFCPDKSSSSFPAIRAAGVFCVNVLADDQEDLCAAFASKATDKFRGLRWHRAGSGSPILSGVTAWLDCAVVEVYDSGDHHVVIGRVTDLDARHRGRGSLVFCRGSYGRFAASHDHDGDEAA